MNTVLAAGDYHYHSKDNTGMLVEWIINHVNPPGQEYMFGVHLPVQAQIAAMILVSVIVFFLFGILYKKNEKVPKGITNFLEVFVMFVRNEISIANLGEKDGKKWAPLFLTFFFFVLGCNLLGLVPGANTATGAPSVTAALAGITFFCMTIGVMIVNGPGNWFSAFVPHGVPRTCRRARRNRSACGLPDAGSTPRRGSEGRGRG